MGFDLEKQSSPYLTPELKTALRNAYRGGKSLGSTEKETAELLDTFISSALSFGASDIHFQNLGEMKILVRQRADGVLKPVLELPPNIADGILSRIKYITHMRLNIPLPQDGRFATTYQDQEVIVRASVIPTRLGESAALRLLADVARPKSLEKLGLEKKDLTTIETSLTRPYGMILVCGPTGCGKTTTVYNMIEKVNKEEVNICTVEDPIEYVIPGVRQIQIDHDVGLNFSVGLRAILRHDPDIVFVGEVRDRETAEIAVDAALTGHLIFTSLHANSAPEAISRMRDLGCRTYLLTATLNIIVAQRLVRKICQKCKTKTKPKREDINLVKTEYGIDISKLDVYEGKGCESCQGYGYHGRTGIFEVLKISSAIKELILANASTGKIFEQARKEGFNSMFEEGLEKVKKGITSLPEVLSATG